MIIFIRIYYSQAYIAYTRWGTKNTANWVDPQTVKIEKNYIAKLI